MMRGISLTLGLITTISGVAVAQEAESRAEAARAEAGQAGRPGTVGGAIDIHRDQFIQVERYARLPAEQRMAGLAEFYGQAAPLLEANFEMLLSSMPPGNLFAKDATRLDGDELNGYVTQLAAAADGRTPEAAADAIQRTHGSNILRIATRRRAMAALLDQRPLLLELVKQDLASTNLDTKRRGYRMSQALSLNEVAERILEDYLAGGPVAIEAGRALVWLPDSGIEKRLLEVVERDPSSLDQHSMLLSGALRGKPAPPQLLKLLDSPDLKIRTGAARALQESGDPALADYLPRMLSNADPQLQLVAIEAAFALPPETLPRVRPVLLPLLEAEHPEVRARAALQFARQKDPAAAKALLAFMKAESVWPNVNWQVVNALSLLTGLSFRYDIHNWGPGNPRNAQEIARFEQWIAANVKEGQ